MKQTGSSIVDQKGRTLQYSLNDFIEEVVMKDNCFLCGANPQDKAFNDEHIFPNWLLNQLKLHDKKFQLPNSGGSVNYGSYKIPCCKECNNTLGNDYEKPLSELFLLNYNQFIKKLSKNDEFRWLIYRWLCLIFLKVHLR